MMNAPASETNPAVISRKLWARFNWLADGGLSVALCALVLPARLLLALKTLEMAGWGVVALAANAQDDGARAGVRRIRTLAADGSIFVVRSSSAVAWQLLPAMLCHGLRFCDHADRGTRRNADERRCQRTVTA